ncbi:MULTISPECIES: hypothetical protein [unclassified Endozoicomonas]|uniref:hypothetical protein n=1 Tax=unclassified Endozoicomonas TaxID=2644528 RepID=UPI003BB662C1
MHKTFGLRNFQYVCVSDQMSLTEIGEIMNIGNMATGLAGVGLTAAASLNTDTGYLARWQARAIMTLASTVGTTLSLVKCCQEGRNISPRTVATLATNAGVLAYSCLQPCAGSYEVSSETECVREFFADGTMSMPKCRRIHHSTKPTEMGDMFRFWRN